MPSDFHDVAHLLRRSGFGGRRSEIEALAGLDWPDAVEEVLDISPNPPVEEGAPDLTRGGTSETDRYVAMTHFWFERARTVPRPIQEKAALFWHGLLGSGLSKVGAHEVMFDQIQLFRRAGLGDVVDLYQRTAVHPATLIHYENEHNVRDTPNDSFARALLEQFILGPGSCSEADVRAAARAWTGHGLTRANGRPRRYRFDPDRHDARTKTFMGVSTPWNGPDIITHLLLGPRRQHAARHISARMWNAFAYPDPAPELVEDLATAFLSGGMRADSLLRAIFLRPEFRSQRARTALMRSPIEFTVAALRHTDLTSADADPQWYSGEMGQSMYESPPIPAPRALGNRTSKSVLWARGRFASHLRWKAYGRRLLADSADLPVEQSVGRALDQFGIFRVSDRTRATLVDFVRGERASTRWAESSGLIFLCLLTPEFQQA